MNIIIFGEVSCLDLTLPFGSNNNSTNRTDKFKSDASDDPNREANRKRFLNETSTLGIGLLRSLVTESQLGSIRAVTVPNTDPEQVAGECLTRQIAPVRYLCEVKRTQSKEVEVTGALIANRINKVSRSANNEEIILLNSVEFDNLFPPLDGSPKNNDDLIVVIFLPQRADESDVEKEEKWAAAKDNLASYLNNEPKDHDIKAVVALSDVETLNKIFAFEELNRFGSSVQRIGVCTMDDFRSFETLNISKGASWEKTVFEFEEQVLDQANLRPLIDFCPQAEKLFSALIDVPNVDHLVVRCDMDGVLISSQKLLRPSMVFYAQSAEGDHLAAHKSQFLDCDEVFLSVALASLDQFLGGPPEDEPVSGSEGKSLIWPSKAASEFSETGQEQKVAWQNKKLRGIFADALIAARQHVEHGYKEALGGQNFGVDRLTVFSKNFFVRHELSEIDLPMDKIIDEEIKSTGTVDEIMQTAKDEDVDTNYGLGEFSTAMTAFTMMNKTLNSTRPEDRSETFDKKVGQFLVSLANTYLTKMKDYRSREFLYSPIFNEGGGNIASSIVDTGKPPIGIKNLDKSHFLGAICKAKFGKFETVDRREIESFRHTNSIFREFIQNGPTNKPLSIAVFGPPGCGKSFGVKQICVNLRKEFGNIIAEDTIDVNLSQLETSDQLVAAFHSIRNVVIGGKVPIVFFDEFDSSNQDQKYYWLKYFLAPMQDGEFRDGESNHKLGKAIFVFAGGTANEFKEFEGKGIAPNEPNEKEIEKKAKKAGEIVNKIDNQTEAEKIEQKNKYLDKLKTYEIAKAAKLPDFASRIATYINISGPNVNGPSDKMFKVRRAYLLVNFVNDINKTRKKSGLPNILVTEPVTKAFLECSNFKHGARSLQTIVQRSVIPEDGKYTLSCLPPESVLSIHVDEPEQFLRTKR